jgi:hypothetical protein
MLRRKDALISHGGPMLMAKAWSHATARAQRPPNTVGTQHARWTVDDQRPEIGWRVPLRLTVGVLLILLWLIPH